MHPAPTERETEILKVLWDLGQASVREVHERLEPETGLHFNTIQTLMRIMDDKGLVTHHREGRSFIYRPRCSRDQLSSRFLHKIFNGEVNELILSMLNSEELSDTELLELENLIANARQQKKQGR